MGASDWKLGRTFDLALVFRFDSPPLNRSNGNMGRDLENRNACDTA